MSVIDRIGFMRVILLVTTALLLAAQPIFAVPATADYKAAEEKLQAGDVAGAIPLLAEEAKLGNPVAAFNLAKIFEDGSAGAPDFQQAATYYKIAAEIDTAPRYNGGALGPQGPELIVAAQKYGQFALGRLYEAGSGVPQDSEEAVFWYTRAADLGLQQAMLKLAVIYQQGLPGPDGSPGVAADPAQSIAWLEKAAEMGNVAAMNELGRAYLGGTGVLANGREAAKWFEKAAAAGSLTAEYSLGSIYRIGFGGQPDFIRAARHFERGANGKESASMVALGDLYANGQGVPQDRIQALAWYKLAALYGQPEGGKRGEMLAASMSPEEQAQAKRKAETWIPAGDQPGTPVALPGEAPMAATPGMTVPAAPATEAPTASVPAIPAAVPVEAAPAAPAPLPASTPTALEWVPTAIPEPSTAPASTVPPAAADPASNAPAAAPMSTPTAADNPINPVTQQPYEPFDPFAPDPYSLTPATPSWPSIPQP